MITQSVFEQARKTPEHIAVVYNDKALSYRAFAHSIALARGFFASRGYVGSGYAVLAFSNLLDFWILSLALRSLGVGSQCGSTGPIEPAQYALRRVQPARKLAATR